MTLLRQGNARFIFIILRKYALDKSVKLSFSTGQLDAGYITHYQNVISKMAF